MRKGGLLFLQETPPKVLIKRLSVNFRLVLIQKNWIECAMTNVDTLEERVRQIDGFIRALTNEAHFLDERAHLLKPLVLDEDVKTAMKAKLDKTPGVGLWNQLTPLLGQDHIRDLARLFLDKGEKTGSLTNIWRKLHALPIIREHYRKSYGSMFDHLHQDFTEGSNDKLIEMRRKEQDELMARFDKGWVLIDQAMKDLDSDPVALSVRTFRDKHHSHWEMQKLGEEPKPFDIETLGLTYNGIFDFGDRCIGILAELGLLLTHESWDPNQFSHISANQGRSLWMTLAQ